MEVFIAIIFVIASFFFMYMSCHIIDEEKKGKCIPLPWEKKRKIFDKSDIEYRDGDNT